MGLIKNHQELDVYKLAFNCAMKIFQFSKFFPKEEKYSLTDQICRSSRSICANLSEAWRKRRYKAAFVAKLNDAEAEAAETITWLDFALSCQYIDNKTHQSLSTDYDFIIGKLVRIISNPTPWLLERKQ
ncbi:MAG: four helix bundle protein [Candidatus Marinimicrobia bacterium]|nr:four helix bundle protein [Candidatus Neomarinimicrobiota bacterium]